jgi:hypothetical protein
VELHNDTLVFLKTNVRKGFYRISDSSHDELTSIEALEYFKADNTEPAIKRIDNHHAHVIKAQELFENKQEIQIESEPTQRTSKGAQVTTALSLMKAVINNTQDSNQRLLLAQLSTLAERGVITYIPKRLEKIAKLLKSGKMNFFNAFEEIFAMAKKYNPYFTAEEQDKGEDSSTIIISESFN